MNSMEELIKKLEALKDDDNINIKVVDMSDRKSKAKLDELFERKANKESNNDNDDDDDDDITLDEAIIGRYNDNEYNVEGYLEANKDANRIEGLLDLGAIGMSFIMETGESKEIKVLAGFVLELYKYVTARLAILECQTEHAARQGCDNNGAEKD